ncbi:MAG: HD-GYP domain-containing protein (c-di-GMP phosphodiesterase class II) [Candidatus Endobugula sp.]|jgi:HD-GYP domain-containing protein (c-di-GMP phosphodiesterase class II)
MKLTDDNSNMLKLPVSSLAIGMYVSRLDKEWLDSSFLYQGFMIESYADICLLEEECTYVWVDPVVENERGNKFEPHHASGKTAPSKTRYINKLSMAHEYDKSHKAFSTSRQKTKAIFDDIVLGGVINTKEIKKTVENCVDSILRNPNAMLWMTKVRDSNSYTADHSLNVCILCIAFGRQLGYEKDELFSLGMCGLLHDVGKIRVPNAILDKPDKLTPIEWKQMQAHVTLGRNLLMASPDIGYSVDVAYNHHERIDGKGYPRGLNGSKLSQHTKIVSLADSYDAMTADRHYSKAITPSAAIKEIYKHRGTQFDEKLALQFIEAISLYPPGTIVELVNGYLAIVLERNQKYRHLPKILLLKDASGKQVKKKLIDLTLTAQGKLEQSFLIESDHPDGYAGLKVADYHHFVMSL